MGIAFGGKEKESGDKEIGIERAERLQYLYDMSSPEHRYGVPGVHQYISKERDFRRMAKYEGFTDEQIDMFLERR